MAEAPLLTFGVLSDIQYADVDNGRGFHGESRYYRNGIPSAQLAMRAFEASGVPFVIHLGDIIDGFARTRAAEAMDQILEPLRHPSIQFHSCIGNHDLYHLTRDVIAEKINYPNKPHFYYSFLPIPQIRIVVLDPFDVSMLGYPPTHEKYQLAEKMLLEHNPNGDLNSPEGKVGVERRWVKFNGAIGAEQLSWLETQLADADQKNERVIICSHVPFCPGSAVEVTLLWNYEEVLQCLHRHRSVGACLYGHDHDGGYAVDDAGLQHLTWNGTLLCTAGETAFGWVDVYADRLEVRGPEGGRVKHRTLNYPN